MKTIFSSHIPSLSDLVIAHAQAQKAKAMHLEMYLELISLPDTDQEKMPETKTARKFEFNV